ncbi:hypothetical protein B0H10DRAFT_2204974 [Mycena sp. CBHHK59/15]|nr:hypothetical protein B0H10DRAFT_2204974 [Mycena sp. CBHHK59/15]
MPPWRRMGSTGVLKQDQCQNDIYFTLGPPEAPNFNSLRLIIQSTHIPQQGIMYAERFTAVGWAVTQMPPGVSLLDVTNNPNALQPPGVLPVGLITNPTILGNIPQIQGYNFPWGHEIIMAIAPFAGLSLLYYQHESRENGQQYLMPRNPSNPPVICNAIKWNTQINQYRYSQHGLSYQPHRPWGEPSSFICGRGGSIPMPDRTHGHNDIDIWLQGWESAEILVVEDPCENYDAQGNLANADAGNNLEKGQAGAAPENGNFGTALLHAVTSRLFLLPPPPPPKPPRRGVEDGFFEVGTTELQAGIRLASCRRGLQADPGWAAGRIGQRREGGGARVDGGSKTETSMQGIVEYFCTPPVMSSALRPTDIVLARGAHILHPFDLPKVGFGLGGGPARHCWPLQCRESEVYEYNMCGVHLLMPIQIFGLRETHRMRRVFFRIFIRSMFFKPSTV